MRKILACATALLLLTTSVWAQGGGYALQSTAITVSDLLAPWIPIINTLAATIVLVLVSLLSKILFTKFGVQMDESQMKVLQSALTNGAGLALTKLDQRAKTVEIEVNSPAVRDAVVYVNNAAADAVKRFDLTSEQLAEKVIAKMGVITASNPDLNVRDVTPPPPDAGKGG